MPEKMFDELIYFNILFQMVTIKTLTVAIQTLILSLPIDLKKTKTESAKIRTQTIK